MTRRVSDWMSRGTAGVPEGVLLESNGISRDLTTSQPKKTAAPALKSRRSHEICQDLTDRRRDHNPRVGSSSPSSATNFACCYQTLTSAEPLAIFLASRSGVPFGGTTEPRQLPFARASSMTEAAPA